MRLIDADALIEDICESLNQMTNIGISVDGEWLWGKLNDALEHAPTIEERKTGKWIDTTQGDHYKCSCCGTRAAFWFNEENSSGWQLDMSEWLSDYCPNCGADMRGEGHE